MKVPLVPGEFGFKVLWKGFRDPWTLSQGVFFNQKEVMEYKEEMEIRHMCPIQILWPVEELDNGSVYVPAEEELK